MPRLRPELLIGVTNTMVEALKLDTIWQAILMVSAAVAALYGAGSAIIKLFGPYKKINQRLDEHDKLLSSGSVRLLQEEKSSIAVIRPSFVKPTFISM